MGAIECEWQIDRDELRAGFLKLGEELTEDDIDAIMEMADDDGDGTIDLSVFNVHCFPPTISLYICRSHNVCTHAWSTLPEHTSSACSACSVLVFFHAYDALLQCRSLSEWER